MRNNNWWKPENLKSSEKVFLKEKNLKKLKINNDFGSYRHMRLSNDVKSSKIYLHNEIKPQFRIKMIKKILENYLPQSILDIGCGLGFSTNEMQKIFPYSKVVGIDISKDAIEYAKVNFSSCRFLCDAIDPDNKNQKFHHDLITAFEFYPFSRTEKLSDHIKYLDHLTKNLSIGGKLIIMQNWNNQKSISKNVKDLKNHFSNLDFKTYDMPIKYIGIIFKPVFVSIFLSKVLRYILNIISKKKIGQKKILIITKKSKN